jgi:hypothetical protein
MPVAVKAAASRPTKAASQPEVSRDEIARVAYQLYEQRGRVSGRDREDWLQAEKIVRARAMRVQR